MRSTTATNRGQRGGRGKRKQGGRGKKKKNGIVHGDEFKPHT